MKPASRFLMLLLTATSSIGVASTITGTVLDVRVNASTTTPGNVRVGVLIPGTTSCSVDEWYSFEYPDSGAGAATGKVWTSQLLVALASGRSVTVAGTGTCDSFGLETIYYIDSL
jgi:hypothetical protein